MAQAKKKTPATTSAKRSPKRTASTQSQGKKGPAQISQIDQELIALLQQRAQLVAKMAGQGPLTLATDLLLEREDGGPAELIAGSHGPLPQRTLEAVFREIVSGCRSLVREMRIAFLGPLHSYSHLAALHRFGQSVQFVPVGTIAAVFEEVNRKHCDLGLVPVENSTDGRIADTLDMFTRLPVRICGQVEMEIHHTLLGKCSRTDVKEVYSKPQALSQCRNWLAKHLPIARTVEVTSTSTAAQLAVEKPGAAAIASLEAGVHYGLDVLAERIEDNPGNVTRFAIIGDEPPPPTGNDRTALLFQVEHRPGTLAEAMNIFKRNDLNLTWIESFPMPGTERGYLFFVELEGHESDPAVQQALATLGKKALRLEVLGAFPAPAMVG